MARHTQFAPQTGHLTVPKKMNKLAAAIAADAPEKIANSRPVIPWTNQRATTWMTMANKTPMLTACSFHAWCVRSISGP